MNLSSVPTRLLAIFQSRWLAPWRLLLGLLIVATIWGWVDVRRRGYASPETPGKHKSDLTVFTEAGAAFFDGRPPYHVCNPRGWTYVYPPVFAIVLAPLHVLPMQDQATVWFFLCLAMCWGAYRESARIVAIIRRSDAGGAVARWFPWLGLTAAVAVTLPTLNCLQRGQATIVIFYLMLLGLRLILDARGHLGRIAGGIVLALPIAIKVVPILPVAFLLFVQLVGFLRQLGATAGLSSSAGNTVGQANRGTRHFAPLGRQLVGSTLGVGLGLSLFLLIVPAALIGWDANLRHLGTWSDLVLSSAKQSTATPGFEKDTHSVRNQCLGNAMYRLGNFGAYMLLGGPEDPMVDGDNPPPRMMDAPSVNTCLLLVRITLLAALMLVGVRLGISGDAPLGQTAAFGLACAALLVVSPVARNHYFILFAPAVLFVPLWLDRVGRRRGAIVLALVPGALILLQYILLPYVGRIGLLGLGTTAWVLAAMVLIARPARSVRVTGTLRDIPAAQRLTKAA